jgi:hypothetical protein
MLAAAHSLVDFSPALRLALLAAVVALLPLSWWWLRQRGGDRRTRAAALTALTMFLTFDLVVFGSMIVVSSGSFTQIRRLAPSKRLATDVCSASAGQRLARWTAGLKMRTQNSVAIPVDDSFATPKALERMAKSLAGLFC